MDWKTPLATAAIVLAVMLVAPFIAANNRYSNSQGAMRCQAALELESMWAGLGFTDTAGKWKDKAAIDCM